MGSKYTSQAVSGFNSSPPSDDGSTASTNKVFWSTIKTKLADPLNTAIAAVNSALVTANDYSARLVTSTDSTVAGDHMRTLEVPSTVTATFTISLADAATMTNGYIVRVRNSSAVDITIGRATVGDTIDGAASNKTLPAGSTAIYAVNAGANGYITQSYAGTLLGPVGGTWTAASTWTLPAFTLGGAVTGNGQNISGLGTLGANATTVTTLTANTSVSTVDLLLQRSTGNTFLKAMRFVGSTTNPLTAAAQGDALAIGNAGSANVYLVVNDTVIGILSTSGINSCAIGQGTAANGTFNVLAKSSGTFDIPHPIREGYRLRHSFIEGPRYDLIYRGTVPLVNGTATVNLDTDCVSDCAQKMTAGTWEALNKDPDIFLQNNSGWSRLKGSIVGATLTITAEDACSDTVSWMVVSERKDDTLVSSISDEHRCLVLEYQKPAQA